MASILYAGNSCRRGSTQNPHHGVLYKIRMTVKPKQWLRARHERSGLEHTNRQGKRIFVVLPYYGDGSSRGTKAVNEDIAHNEANGSPQLHELQLQTFVTQDSVPSRSRI